ncbi:tRNA1(Val) (adenine(37)-N6)-methyltransferase [Algoriphagus halophilus]|uniref:tRNA1(Val) (adenine(37)-N6)-methyltransferase n=1 Tax=Algoriphagus halophilus TaxID=226505 RepID=A0A1N6HSR1_9BACT|nr:methyltransferase [Algoriphagus halophilus]SIO22908.1 tRNA1Val (adenine37-N6)-methyltransferase [Algoriphagus halophilus]
MANTWFQFQQFRVHQDQCAMKISTDAVLLGGLASIENPQKILDIGTGTGVISLMLAQRYPIAQVIGIELDNVAANQAGENFNSSPFSSRMKIWEGRFQEFNSEEKFDLIVSNPPYFPDHLKSQNSKRNQALHTDTLSFRELVCNSASLLSKEGCFWVILPPRQMQDLREVSKEFGLSQWQSFTVQDKPGKRVIREMVCFGLEEKEFQSQEIFIKNEDGTAHPSYQKIVSGFLLEFP